MIIFFFVKQLVVNMHVYVYVYIAQRTKKFKGTTPLICGRELGEEGGEYGAPILHLLIMFLCLKISRFKKNIMNVYVYG